MKRIATQFLAIMALAMMATTGLHAQIKLTKRSADTRVSMPAAPKFNADDLSGNLKLSTSGTPWAAEDVSPIKLPEGVKAVIPDPLPAVSKVTVEEYNAAVTMAFESMRIVYGEMSESDAKRFLAMWAPLYDTPSQELIDYFNALNPLLSQFLAAREAYFQTAADLQMLQTDIAEAVAIDDRGTFDGIMFQYNLLVGSLKSLEAAIVEIANRIQLLGNPPNPFIAKANARKKYNSAFAKKEVKAPYIGDCLMGTRTTNIVGKELPALTEVVFRYIFRANVEGSDRYYVIELCENGIPSKDDLNDASAALKYVDVRQFECYNDDGKVPDCKSDGMFQNYLPKPPVMAITSMTMNYLMLKEQSMGRDEEYYNAVCNFGNRILGAGFFFKAAVNWSIADKWNDYTFYKNGVIPGELLSDFAEEVRNVCRQDMANRAKSAKERKAIAAKEREEMAFATQPMTEEQLKQKAVRDSLEHERKSKEESIKTRQELIREIEQQIQRENEYKSRASQRYYSAKTDAERQSARAEMEDIDRRIMYMRSNIQNERDNIQTLQTGEYVHTRTDFDQYAHARMVQSMKEDAVRRAATRRYAERIERQIDLLPEDQKEDARDRADKLFYDDGALVSGDIERARKLSKLFNNQILAKELKVQAEAQEDIAYADLKEAGANAVIMACGSVTVGLAAEAYTAAYGATASIVTYGPKVIGAVYGGVTGFISGGVSNGICSAAGSIHPATQAMASFYQGYTDEANAGKSTNEKIWEGVKKAGIDYVIGKGIETGANAFAKTCSYFTSKGTTKLSFKEKLDLTRTQRQRLEAQDAVNTFTQVDGELKQLIASGASKAQIDAARASRDKLAAVLNADYHAKWYMKYKADPKVSASFSEGVNANYDRMMPKMKAELQAKGFNMDDIEFKQFRNASSAGTSSMDLDLSPVSKASGKEPLFFRNGKQVSASEFMDEAQKTMNSVYRQQTGMSAKASEMNLTTSAHPEAYQTEELLKRNIDFGRLTKKDVSSVGRVIDVKMSTIEENIHMSQTTKVQAKAREATKEIENMLIPKLKYDLKNAKNAKDASAIAENIEYWQDMQKLLTEMSKRTNQPLEILNLNNQIKAKTGGKDATQVVFDLAREFDVKW